MKALVAYKQKEMRRHCGVVVMQTLTGDVQALGRGCVCTDTESGCAVNANTYRGYAGIGSVSTEKCGVANTERGYAGIGLQTDAERDV